MEQRLANPPQWLSFAMGAAVCWVIVFWNLAGPPLMDPDEAHYAQLTREMVRAGSWMIPLLDGLPYIDKPVLFHWLQGLAVAVLGETETAMRLPSALAAMALFWLTQWAGVQLFGQRVGLRAWLMLATMPLTFMLSGIGLFDMVFTALLFGAVAVAMVSALRHRSRLQYVSYVLLSLAVMTKGPVALLLAGAFFLAGLACGRECRAALLSLRWKTGAAMSVALSLPWFVWMYAALGWHFVHQYVLAGNLYYVTQPLSFSNRAVNHTLYVATFFAGFFPWSFVTLGAAVYGVRRWRAKVTLPPEEMLLWAWIGVVFIFFSLARFKVDRYVYPAAPACCLLAAREWLRVCAAVPGVAARWPIVLLGTALVAVGVVGGASLFDLGVELPSAAVLMPIALGAGGAAVVVMALRRGVASPALIAVVVIALLVVYGGVVTMGPPLLARARPTAAVARDVRARLAGGEQIGLYRLENLRFSLRYYLESPVSRLQHPADVSSFLGQRDGAHILMRGEDVPRLRGEGVSLRVVSEHPAVTGTTGRGLRRQKWGSLVVVTLDDTPRVNEKTP